MGGLLAAMLLLPAAAQATMVRMVTNYGPIDVVLFDAAAPITVANFLKYVNAGRYDNSFFHRSVSNFIVQGGGFNWVDPTGPVNIPEFPTIVREYSAERPNARGTISMARLGGQPNSASSEWFFNTVDNSTTLGPNNDGGYAVFGRATQPSMVAVDAIARLPIRSLAGCFGGVFGEVPLVSIPAFCNDVRTTHVPMILSARVLPGPDTLDWGDRIFNYIEAAYPQYAKPASPPSQVLLGYYARHYTATDCYLGIRDNQVFALCAPLGPDIVALGSVTDWLHLAVAAGY